MACTIRRLVTAAGAMMACAALAACGNNDCENALDKQEECEIDTSEADEDAAAECNEQDECEAKCVDEASCEDLTDAQSANPAADNPYVKCVAECK